MTTAANELSETMAEGGPARGLHMSFPHARMAPERAKVYEERLSAIVEDLIAEPHDPDGHVYGMCVTLFHSPDYMQGTIQSAAPAADGEGEA